MSSSKPAFDPSEHPHRRYNPLTRSFVLCSPHRTKRPWQGAQESPQTTTLPPYDEKCYLCPGNDRATGGKNEDYKSTFYFENDYAALMPLDVDSANEADSHPLLRMEPARGRCYVICFHPSHNLTLAQLSTAPHSPATHIVPIIQAWQNLYRRIPTENPFVRYVQIFENKGSAMGCSNPHPHGQVWSLDYVPEEPAKELESQRAWALDPNNADDRVSLGVRDHKGRPSLLLTIARLELTTPGRPRVICDNEHFVALVPFWAVWPFEVLVVPAKRQIPSLAELSDDERAALANILGEVACRLDNIFQCSFPYSMGIHQRPVPEASPASHDHQHGDEECWDHAQLHIHFYPPLLRSASVRKFLVGFEMMGEPQRDLTAEQAAKRIRDCDTIHYLAKLQQ
ncbi:galactose-1-phosphate uridyl transferase [Thecaphora frezii]